MSAFRSPPLFWVSVALAACGGASAPTVPKQSGANHAEHRHDAVPEHYSSGRGEPGPGASGAHLPGAHDPSHGFVGHRFEDAERWAKQFDDPARDAWQKPEHIVDLLALRAGMVVADVGAGTGYFLPYLSRAVGAGGKVLGLDIEPDMVRYMKDRTQREDLRNVAVRQVAPDDPGLAAGGVDRILIVDTWHHIANRDQYAKKLGEALSNGGRVYVVDFTRETRRGPPQDHRVSSDQVMTELRAAGLEASVIEESLPDQYVVVGEK